MNEGGRETENEIEREIAGERDRERGRKRENYARKGEIAEKTVLTRYVEIHVCRDCRENICTIYTIYSNKQKDGEKKKRKSENKMKSSSKEHVVLMALDDKNSNSACDTNK